MELKVFFFVVVQYLVFFYHIEFFFSFLLVAKEEDRAEAYQILACLAGSGFRFSLSHDQA